MIPDKRKQRLNAFRHATKICCALLLVFGTVYFSVAILPIALNPEGNPELIRHFNTNLLLLNGITLAQILIASLMFGLASKKTGSYPFSRSMAFGSFGLGILFAAQVIVRGLIASSAAKLLFAGDAVMSQLHFAALDVSGLLIALGLIACPFLLMYGRELWIDSDEIA